LIWSTELLDKLPPEGLMADSENMTGARLAKLFVAILPEASRANILLAKDTESLLQESLQRAQQAWPNIALNNSNFISFLAQRVADEPDPISALQALRVSDLFLCCACLKGDTRALAEFTNMCRSVVEGSLAGRAQTSDEVIQILTEKLLTHNEKREAKLSQYRGRGSLRKWIKVAALRLDLNLRRQHSWEASADQELMGRMVGGENQELAYLKRVYQREFKIVFHDILAAMSPRERNLLRSYVLHELSYEQIGALYRIHRTTASRWLQRIQDKLFQETKKALMKRLRVKPAEFDSIMLMVMSQFDASLRRVLKDEEK
jgi:RNA polymerase sigma-70 factor, ECF subfamily